MKYRAMMDKFGFAIPGFKYYNTANKTIERKGREFGFTMTPDEGIQSIDDFTFSRPMSHSDDSPPNLLF